MKLIHVRGNTYCIETGLLNIPFYKINDHDIILLDSGWAEERQGMIELLNSHHLNVKGIINSHAHIDHIGNNAYFKEQTHALIAMPAFEAMICESLVNLKVYYNTLSLTQIEEHLNHLVHKVDVLIYEIDNEIHFCGIHFKIIHSKGHSPAHICLVTPDDVAYLGDALLSNDVMESSKMPYAFIIQKDLESKLNLLNISCHQYILAHKAIVDDITKLVTVNIDYYKARAQHIYHIIESEMTFEAIFKMVLKEFNIRFKHIIKYVSIERMLRSYIEYLTEINWLEIIMNEGIVQYKKKFK